MNIQIFASKRNFDVQKAERYFKERRIPAQFIDISKKPMGRRELESVCAAVGLEALVKPGDDWESAYILQANKAEALDKLCENQRLLNTPIVRNGKQATVGFRPEVWEGWK